jgi:hypothetical protein
MASARLHNGQGVRLSASTVKRHHEVGHQALARRVVARQALQFRDQFGALPGSQVRFGASFQRRQAPLSKLVAYAGDGELIAQVGQGIALPQRQGFAKYRGRTGRVLGQQLLGFRHQVVKG